MLLVEFMNKKEEKNDRGKMLRYVEKWRFGYRNERDNTPKFSDFEILLLLEKQKQRFKRRRKSNLAIKVQIGYSSMKCDIIFT